MADEAVEDFRSSLTDLTFNSKPLINMLTMLAEENVQYAEQIVKVIEEHIQKAASSHKLPALYLIDSIIKNVSNSNYLQLFKRNIVATFVFVFDKVDEKTRQSMFKLRQTWNDLFPPEKLFTLDVQVNHIDPAWPITAQPRAGTSIHVNPKFLIKAPQGVDSSSPADVQPKSKSASAPAPSKKSKVKESEPTLPKTEDEEALIRDMVAKKQELLRLEQKKLELQLAEARASLEQQAKKLAAQQAVQTESTLLAQQSTRTSVPTTNLRDPRVKTDAAISSAATASVTTSTSQRLAPVLSAPVQFSGHMNKSEAVGSNVAESAVPLKTPTVSAANTCLPSHSVVTQQSPASAPGSSVSAAGNIFDRILDLVPGPTPAPRSEASSQLAVTASSTVPVTAQQPVVKEETVSRNETVNDVKKLTTPLPEETKAAAEPASTTSAVAGEARKVGKNVGLKNASKKSVEGSSLSRPLMAGRRRTSSHDKKGSGASSGKKEKESGPALKKVKQSKEVTKTTKDLKPSGLSSDLEELFGKEDKDYRRLPPIPKLDPAASQKQPLLGPAPAQELMSPQSTAWANFKADHPEAFPFRQSSQTRRLSAAELTARRKHPGSLSSKQALLPTPAVGTVDKSDASSGKKPLISGDKAAADLWPQREENQVYNPSNLHPAVRRPLVMDANSRSPQRHERLEDRSPRYDDHAGPLPVKGSLLGDKPPSGRPGAGGMNTYNGPDEPPKSLLPAPGLHMMRLEWQTAGKRPDDIPLWDAPVKATDYDEDRFYVPEYDVRWCVRAQVGDRSSNMYTVFINDRQFEMAINSKRRIQCNNSNIEVILDSPTRQLKIDDIGCYRFGCPPKNVNLKGNTYRIFVRGPEKKLWIDDRLFEINVDSPPERIIIGEKEHKIAIDGAAGRIFVDGFDICPFGTEEEQVVQLAYVMHTITFKPPQKQILIDGNLCTVDLSGKFPVVWINNRPRGIRFDGEPREIFIDDTPWTVPMNNARKCRIDGPKPRLLAFGGPGHEVIIDDQWFEVKFGGEAKIVKFGGRTHKIQLRGNPPEVKILPEVIPAHDLQRLMDRRGYGERSLVNRLDPRSDVCGRSLPPPPVPVPSLLDLPERPMPGFRSDPLPRDPRLAASASLDQFPGTNDSRRPSGLSSGTLQRNASAASLSRMLEPSGQHGTSEQYLSQPRDRLDEDLRHLHNGQQIIPGTSVPDVGSSRSDQYQSASAAVPAASSVYRGFGEPGVVGGLAPSIDAVHPPADSSGDRRPEVAVGFSQTSGEGSNSTAQALPSVQTPAGGMIDVNLLLSQLLAKGLIGQPNSAAQTSAAKATTPPPTNQETNKQSAVAAADQQNQTQPPDEPVTVQPSSALEEQKEIARKEEELIESIPSITDFEPDTLRKRYSGAIQQLYVGICCSSCGLRFKSDCVDQYQEHLDWHFRQNRNEKEGSKVAKFRQWYYDVVDWVQFEEVTDLEEKAQGAVFDSGPSVSDSSTTLPESLAKLPDVIVCPEASDSEKGDICEMCREKFEQFWNEEHEAWHLKDAIAVKGKIYHPVCFEDSAKEGRQSDTSAVFADQSLLDVSTMADDDERLIDSTSLDDPPITVDQLSSSVSRAECNDSGELPLVADAATAQLAADIKPIVIGKLDRQSSGNNCSLDNRAIAKSSDDRIADSSQSVAVVSGSIGLNAEKSSEDMLDVLDVVIKREIGEGLEQCPAPAVSCVPVEMETDVTDEQLKTDACSRTEGSGMEVDASEMADVTVKSENS